MSSISIEHIAKVFDRCFITKFESTIKPYINKYISNFIDTNENEEEDRGNFDIVSNKAGQYSSDLDKQLEEKIRFIIDDIIVEKLEKIIKPIAESIVNEKMEHKTKRMVGGQRRPALNSFGQESYDHMLLPYMSNLLRSSNDMHFILQKVITDLFFNPEQKRNHTVYINPDTLKYICIYKDNMWKNYKSDFVLDKVIKRGNDVLQHYLFGLDSEQEMLFKQEIGKKKFDILKDFTEKLDNIEEHDDLRDLLLRNTEHTILTHQHIVHKHKFEIPSD